MEANDFLRSSDRLTRRVPQSGELPRWQALARTVSPRPGSWIGSERVHDVCLWLSGFAFALGDDTWMVFRNWLAHETDEMNGTHEFYVRRAVFPTKAISISDQPHCWPMLTADEEQQATKMLFELLDRFLDEVA